MSALGRKFCTWGVLVEYAPLRAKFLILECFWSKSSIYSFGQKCAIPDGNPNFGCLGQNAPFMNKILNFGYLCQKCYNSDENPEFWVYKSKYSIYDENPEFWVFEPKCSIYDVNPKILVFGPKMLRLWQNLLFWVFKSRCSIYDENPEFWVFKTKMLCFWRKSWILSVQAKNAPFMKRILKMGVNVKMLN